MSNNFVSIIIPTYKDWTPLLLCLKALSRQTFPREMFEIIIVDNNSNSQDSIPQDFELPDNCRMIAEEKPGSYAARNRALKIAKGNIIGFTDSDCIPDENWIKNALDYFNNHPKCSRIAGKISIFRSSLNSVIEVYDQLYAFPQKGYVDNSGTSVTANLFTYKDVFDKVGYFDEALMSGGDFLWGTMANKQGYDVDYVENVIVKHPARNTLEELLKKEKRVGGSQAIFLKKNSSKLLNILKFLRELRPRLSEIKFIYFKGKGLSTMSKIYIYLLRQYLVGIRAYAKLRAQMGKKPNRA